MVVSKKARDARRQPNLSPDNIGVRFRSFAMLNGLKREYVDAERSASDIATQFGVTDAAIFFWLKRHNIPRRSISEARAIKHWGVEGSANPMFGRTGADNPRYIDGSSPERQRLYAQSVGRKFVSTVLRRDNYHCRRCSLGKIGKRGLHVHHIKPWAGNPDLRFDLNNAVTLCQSCHRWVHSKANMQREFIA